MRDVTKEKKSLFPFCCDLNVSNASRDDVVTKTVRPRMMPARDYRRRAHILRGGWSNTSERRESLRFLSELVCRSPSRMLIASDSSRGDEKLLLPFTSDDALVSERDSESERGEKAGSPHWRMLMTQRTHTSDWIKQNPECSEFRGFHRINFGGWKVL